MKKESRKVSEIIFREDLYPRFNPESSKIQQYSECLELLPPIEINQKNELIDGYHRWIAYKKMNKETIDVIITETKNDVELDRISTERNTKHGIQLTMEEKKEKALKWFNGIKGEDDLFANILSVSISTIKNWLSRKKKDLKMSQQRQVLDLWLACYTETEIADKLNLEHQTINNWVKEELQNLTILAKFAIFKDFAEPEWEPPLYSEWKVKQCGNSTKHFGNTEALFLDRLLYMYTKPFEIVLDPFAGGGSTIDICKKRLRRYYVSDRKPIIEREKEIRLLDIIKDLPHLNGKWKDVGLVYLDPPYWKQAENEYSKDPEDLANMNIELFYNSLINFISEISKKMREETIIALIIQPTQWKAPDRFQPIDHIIDLILKTQNISTIKYLRRISCPYESQQFNAQQVEWAKKNKDILINTREIILWRVKK